MAYRIFMDSFSGAIGDMKPADQKDSRKVLAVLDKSPRFSCFEASERPAIANTMTDLMLSGFIEYPKPQPGFPWSRAVITAKGSFVHGRNPIMLTVNQRLAIERVIIKHLIETMAAHGWKVDHVWDGGDEVRNTDIGAQLDAVFAVDESQIIFENPQGRQHWVSIVLGNGTDCISDYSYAQHHADDFEQIMALSTAFVETLEGVSA